MRKDEPFSSLTGKLLIAIGTLVLVVSSVFWFFLIKYQEKELLKSFVRYGTSFTDNVKKSTRYGMLTSESLIIQQTIEAVASTEGVMRVRIYNCTGRIAHSSLKEERGATLPLTAPACAACHAGQRPAAAQKWFISKGDGGFRVLNVVQPVYNEPACYVSSCHVHPRNKRVLGFVEANFSLELMDMAIEQQSFAISAYVLVFLGVLSVVLCTILWKLVSTPVHMLAEGMRKVAAGDLDHKVIINTKDEMGELAQSFNAMTEDLSRAKGELLDWGRMLERRVAEKTDMIKRTQAHLIQSEKLASLGRLAAGVAHEINNPLTGIVTFGHLLYRKFPEGSEEKEDVKLIIEQAERCSNIIKGLLGFARGASPEKTDADINVLLKGSLDIIGHKADFFNIKIVVDLADKLPPVKAGGAQLQQVFLNMVLNAADAMAGEGTLRIATRRTAEGDQEWVEIDFADSGHGISEEDLPKIFEPFFTTKPVGKGTGLGLAISYGIIEDHGGNIKVKSEVGKGTTFTIRLPISPEHDAQR
ncbi:MAG: ATP-binding protein [Nitrospirota bacterium]